MKESAESIQSPDLAAACLAERARIARLAREAVLEGDYDHPVFGEGNLPSPLLLVGEAPGREEAASGRPFVGRAGRQLNALLAAAGIDRQDVYVTNVVKFRPVVRGKNSVRNRTPSREEWHAGLPLLKTELEAASPKWIATLGNTPLSAMLTIGELEKKPVGVLHGTVISMQVGGREYRLFPLYHPASGIYNPALLPVMEADAVKLGAWIAGTVKIM